MSANNTIYFRGTTIVHFNINSVTAEGRLEELAIVCDTIKADVLILTESKLSENVPNNLVTISGFHEPLRREVAFWSKYLKP